MLEKFKQEDFFDSKGIVNESIESKKFDHYLIIEKGSAGEKYLAYFFDKHHIKYADVTHKLWAHDFELKDKNLQTISKIQVKATSCIWSGKKRIDCSGYEDNSFDVICIVSLKHNKCLFIDGQKPYYSITMSMFENDKCDWEFHTLEKVINKKIFK